MAPMRKWLVRLTFSFFVIAGACAWEGIYGDHSPAKHYLLVCAAAVSLGLGVASLRERHRKG
jgi:hypothetical protein